MPSAPARLKASSDSIITASPSSQPLAAAALSIALLLGSGAAALGAAGATAPVGWVAMGAIGVVMIAVFAVIAFGPMARARRAARDADWAVVGAALQRVHRLVQLNFALGWLAVAWVVLA